MVRGSVKEIERCCIFNERVPGIDCGLLCVQEEEHLSKPAIYKESHIYKRGPFFNFDYSLMILCAQILGGHTLKE